MQVISIENGYATLEAYANADYFRDREKISKNCLDIIESYANAEEEDEYTEPYDYDDRNRYYDEDFDDYQDAYYDDNEDEYEEKSPADAHLEAKEYFEKITDDFFYDESQGMIYVLYNIKKEPVAYAIFGRKGDSNVWVLELIHTHYDHAGCGYGTILLKECAKNLVMFCGAEEIVSIINEKNYKSLALHDSFIKNNELPCNIDQCDDRYAYTIDISNILNKDKNKDEHKE